MVFHSFTGSCPVFPAPFIEEAVFAPLYILASFVKNKVPIGAWVYFWAFYLVPLVCISVFVPVPYCLGRKLTFTMNFQLAGFTWQPYGITGKLKKKKKTETKGT